MVASIDHLARKLALAIIKFYQRAISPSLGIACRFEPSCSQYAIEAFEGRGFVFASVKTLGRLSRCRPGGGSGYDPVS